MAEPGASPPPLPPPSNASPPTRPATRVKPTKRSATTRPCGPTKKQNAAWWRAQRAARGGPVRETRIDGKPLCCLPNLRTRALRPARRTALVVQRRWDPLTLARCCFALYTHLCAAFDCSSVAVQTSPCGTWVCLGIFTLISPNESLATRRGVTQSRQRGRRTVQYPAARASRGFLHSDNSLGF